MYGSSLAVETAVLPRVGVEDFGGGDELRQVAGRLHREFEAPVGVLDPSRGSWRVRLGADAGAFPRAEAALLAALTASGVDRGQAALWRGGPGDGPVWLAFPVPWVDRDDLVVLAGFATVADVAGATRWGPVCPERALRAWGQSVADKLRVESARGAPAGFDGGEHLFISRLIRRLRISDHPERFQSRAVKALRSTLGVAAVAWVPSQPGEPAIVSGEVEGLKARDYHALVPPSQTAPVHIDNHARNAPGTALRRLAAVSADAQGTIGWLLVANPIDDHPFAVSEIESLQPVASLISTQQANAGFYADLKELLFGIIRALTAAIDAKDPYTSGHSERVARIAVRLAEELGMPPHQRGDLYLMGLLHDVGKIGIDDQVLKKTGPLTPDEYRVIQSHVEIGVHILKDLKKLRHLLPGVRHHHESLDGTGYPDRLAGDAIPWEARILAVADSFDAMSSTRPYRRRLTPSQIDEIFHTGAGAQWDPRVVDALFVCRPDVEHIRQKGLGESLQVVVGETLNRSDAAQRLSPADSYL
jgi:HD-GYP domain-containing protein (c-di-GMP phosphodiesterase class II)